MEIPPTHRAVDQAITTRRSLRAFKPNPIDRAIIEDILRVASRAPSGTNTQPWRVYVLTGAVRDSLTEKVLAVFNDPKALAQLSEDYNYYPKQWKSPFIERRRKVGWDLYGLLGITRDNKAGMHAQHARNYQFFDAPVGLMFSIDRSLEIGSWLDYGMFIQSVMVAARGRGIDTCPQQAWSRFHRIIAEHVGMGQDEQFICGMSMGYARTDAIENSLETDREPVSSFTTFLDGSVE